MPIIGVPAGFFDEVLTVPVVEGSTSALAEGQAVVQMRTADDKEWAVGDTISVSGGAGSVEVQIGAIIDSQAIGMPVVLAAAQYTAVADPTTGTDLGSDCFHVMAVAVVVCVVLIAATVVMVAKP